MFCEITKSRTEVELSHASSTVSYLHTHRFGKGGGIVSEITGTMQRAASSLPRLATRVATPLHTAGSTRGAHSFASTVYNVVYKRNVTYITYIVAGAVLVEVVYGKVTDSFWNWQNHGVSAGSKWHDDFCDYNVAVSPALLWAGALFGAQPVYLFVNACLSAFAAAGL